MESFCVNDIVFYPFHGVCRIVNIEKHCIMGNNVDCYVLCFEKGSIDMIVPMQSFSDIGVRKVITPSEVQGVIGYINEDDFCVDEENFSVRYTEHQAKLKSGNIYDMGDVLRRLKKRSREKKLSAADRRMLKTVQRMLVEEIAFVLGISETEAEKRINA